MIKSNYLLAFKEMEWNSPAVGVREKRFEHKGETIRLLEFSYGFIEQDWCVKGHKGYVIEGSLFIDFNGKRIKYEKGDGIWIEEGEKNKHKAIINEGEKVLIVLFE